MVKTWSMCGDTEKAGLQRENVWMGRSKGESQASTIQTPNSLPVLGLVLEEAPLPFCTVTYLSGLLQVPSFCSFTQISFD